jgi:hypothetical protein
MNVFFFSSIVQIVLNQRIKIIEINGKIHIINIENVFFIIAPRKKKTEKS